MAVPLLMAFSPDWSESPAEWPAGNDMAVRFSGAVYLFEFKVVEQAGTGSALAQLKVGNYAEKHRGTSLPLAEPAQGHIAPVQRAGRAIHLMGVEFSREARNVVAFDVEQD